MVFYGAVWYALLTVLYPSITSLVAGNTTGGGYMSLMCPQWVRTCNIIIYYLQFHSDGLIFAANCCIIIAIIMI